MNKVKKIGEKKQTIKGNRKTNMNKLTIGPPLIFALFVITAVNCGPVNEYTNLHESIGVGIGHCNKWDQEELERGHLQCTR